MRRVQLFEFEWWRCPDGYTVISDVRINKTYEEELAEYQKSNRAKRMFRPVKSLFEDKRPKKELIRHIKPNSDALEKYTLNFGEETIVQDFIDLLSTKHIYNTAKVTDFACKYGLLFESNKRTEENINFWESSTNFIKDVFLLYRQPHGQNKAYERFNEGTPHLMFAPKIQAGNSRTYSFLSLQPQNLFSAICLQLINDVTAGIDLVPCQARGCNNMFPYTRKDRKTCQPSCKKRLQRDKKAQETNT